MDRYVRSKVARLPRGACCIGPFVRDRNNLEGKPLSIAMVEPVGEGCSFRSHVEDGAKRAIREPGRYGVLVELLAYVMLGEVDVHRYLQVIFDGDQILLYFHISDVQWKLLCKKRWCY